MPVQANPMRITTRLHFRIWLLRVSQRYPPSIRKAHSSARLCGSCRLPLASLTLIIVGLSIRRLAPQSDGWTASTFATAGLVLMPGFHSAAASGSPESLMFLAIASLTGAVIHAMRRKWSLTATLLVGASAALLVSTRQCGLPDPHSCTDGPSRIKAGTTKYDGQVGHDSLGYYRCELLVDDP